MKLTLLLILLSTTLHAAEFFVNKQGLDSNAGTSRAAAFLTIQKGVDALQPGDTLSIGRGEYAEAVARKGLGSAEKETVIRAEIPGTVLLRGDVDAPVFRPPMLAHPLEDAGDASDVRGGFQRCCAGRV